MIATSFTRFSFRFLKQMNTTFIARKKQDDYHSDSFTTWVKETLFYKLGALGSSLDMCRLVNGKGVRRCILEYMCHNPTSREMWGRHSHSQSQPHFGQVWGEAQHLEKLEVGVLRDSRMFRARQQGPKHLALGCSWCHWKGLET